jgi:hypothetical protein
MELKPIKKSYGGYISIDNLYEFISMNKSFLETLGIIIVSNRICEGDRYYSEDGNSFKISILDEEFEIGYLYITEDSDNWAQAECHKTSWISKIGKNQDTKITINELYEMIVNFKDRKREKKLNDILK